jgi:hypothetical protein
MKEEEIGRRKSLILIIVNIISNAGWAEESGAIGSRAEFVQKVGGDSFRVNMFKR